MVAGEGGEGRYCSLRGGCRSSPRPRLPSACAGWLSNTAVPTGSALSLAAAVASGFVPSFAGAVATAPVLACAGAIATDPAPSLTGAVATAPVLALTGAVAVTVAGAAMPPEALVLTAA